jgi:hypothetical protein
LLHVLTGDLYQTPERTIVDGAYDWLARYAETRPALKQMLADDSLRKRAKRLTRVWRRACEMRIKELRKSDAIRAQRSLSQAHRASAEVLRAVATQHSTFVRAPVVTMSACALLTSSCCLPQAVFLSEPLDGLQRWQSAFLCLRAYRVSRADSSRALQCL